MGFYIETPMNFEKAEQMEIVGAIAIDQPGSIDDLPEGQTLLCVVQNGLFDAVGICYDDQELAAFGDPSDPRKKTWMSLPSPLARKLCPKYDDYLTANV